MLRGGLDKGEGGGGEGGGGGEDEGGGKAQIGFIALSYDIGVEKPHPGIFRAARWRAGGGGGVGSSQESRWGPGVRSSQEGGGEGQGQESRRGPGGGDRSSQERRQEELREDECVHIGDDAERDYWGAKGAGWGAVLIRRDGVGGGGWVGRGQERGRVGRGQEGGGGGWVGRGQEGGGGGGWAGRGQEGGGDGRVGEGHDGEGEGGGDGRVGEEQEGGDSDGEREKKVPPERIISSLDDLEWC